MLDKIRTSDPQSPLVREEAVNELGYALLGRKQINDDQDGTERLLTTCATLVAALGHWLRDPRYPLDARMCQAAAVIGDGLRASSISAQL